MKHFKIKKIKNNTQRVVILGYDAPLNKPKIPCKLFNNIKK